MSNSTEAVGFRKRRWIFSGAAPDPQGAARLARELGREIAGPAVARKMLGIDA